MITLMLVHNKPKDSVLACSESLSNLWHCSDVTLNEFSCKIVRNQVTNCSASCSCGNENLIKHSDILSQAINSFILVASIFGRVVKGEMRS